MAFGYYFLQEKTKWTKTTFIPTECGMCVYIKYSVCEMRESRVRVCVCSFKNEEEEESLFRRETISCFVFPPQEREARERVYSGSGPCKRGERRRYQNGQRKKEKIPGRFLASQSEL